MFPVTKRPLLEKHCLSRGPLSENFPMLCNMHALTVIQGKDLSYYCIGPLLYLGLLHQEIGIMEGVGWGYG